MMSVEEAEEAKRASRGEDALLIDLKRCSDRMGRLEEQLQDERGQVYSACGGRDLAPEHLRSADVLAMVHGVRRRAESAERARDAALDSLARFRRAVGTSPEMRTALAAIDVEMAVEALGAASRAWRDRRRTTDHALAGGGVDGNHPVVQDEADAEREAREQLARLGRALDELAAARTRRLMEAGVLPPEG